MVEELRKRKLRIPLVLGLLLSLLSIFIPIKYVLVAGMAVIGCSLILYDLRIGLMGAVLIIPFLPDILGLLYLIFLLMAYLWTNIFRTQKDLTKDIMHIPIGVYLMVILISTITSINPMGSLRDLSLHMAGFFFLFVMVGTVDNKDDFNKILTTIIFAASLISLYGLYQYIVGVEVDAAWVDVENNPDIRTRIYSVFYNPNILAEYLIMITPLSIAAFWYTKKLSKKILFFGTTILMSLNILLTLSRGGWLGFAFAVFVFVLLIERRLLLTAIPISIGAVYLLPTTILNRILSIGNLSDSSNSYRLKLWEITGSVIKDNWVAGVGFGHLPFKQTFESYIRTMPTYHAHNTLLQVTAEIGLFGLLAFIFFLWTMFKYGILILNRAEDKYIRIVGAGVISGLAGLMLHGIVENVLYIPRIIITFWTMVAFLLTLVKLEKNRQAE